MEKSGKVYISIPPSLPQSLYLFLSYLLILINLILPSCIYSLIGLRGRGREDRGSRNMLLLESGIISRFLGNNITCNFFINICIGIFVPPSCDHEVIGSRGRELLPPLMLEPLSPACLLVHHTHAYLGKVLVCAAEVHRQAGMCISLLGCGSECVCELLKVHRRQSKTLIYKRVMLSETRFVYVAIFHWGMS